MTGFVYILSFSLPDGTSVEYIDDYPKVRSAARTLEDEALLRIPSKGLGKPDITIRTSAVSSWSITANQQGMFRRGWNVRRASPCRGHGVPHPIEPTDGCRAVRSVDASEGER